MNDPVIRAAELGERAVRALYRSAGRPTDVELIVYADAESFAEARPDDPEMDFDLHRAYVRYVAGRLRIDGVIVALKTFDAATYRRWLGKRKSTVQRRAEFMAGAPSAAAGIPYKLAIKADTAAIGWAALHLCPPVSGEEPL